MRQRIDALESTRKRQREAEEGLPPCGESARRRMEGTPSSQDVPGDPEPWRRDPAWMPSWLHREACRLRAEQEDASLEEQLATSQQRDTDAAQPPRTDHHLMTVGPLLFCNRCGAYGLARAGSKLMGQCGRAVSRDVKLRLERMRQGLHPITGAQLARGDLHRRNAPPALSLRGNIGYAIIFFMLQVMVSIGWIICE